MDETKPQAGGKRIAIAAGVFVALSYTIVPAKADPVATTGVVYAQGLVTKEKNGERVPEFAEYDNTTGTLVNVLGDIPNESGKADRSLWIASGEDRRQAALQYRSMYTGLSAHERERVNVVSRNEYERLSYPDGVSKQIALQTSRSLLVVTPDSLRIPSGTGSEEDDERSIFLGTILFESPYDLDELREERYDTAKSLLLNGNGQIKHESQHTIGFRVAYVQPRSDGDKYEERSARYEPGDELLAPISNVQVTTGVPLRGSALTDEEGRYLLYLDMPGCYGYSENIEIPVYASIPYRTFNPQRKGSLSQYLFSGTSNYLCTPLPFYSPQPTISGNIAQIDAIEQILLNRPGPTPVHFPIDLTVVSGRFKLRNTPGASAIPVAEKTTYELLADSEQAPELPKSPDFNEDGRPDHLSNLGSIDGVPGPVELLYGVWFDTGTAKGFDSSGRPIDVNGEIMNPDLVRVANYPEKYDDIGLLQTISEKDLRQTDLYVFRESTGQIVVEKEPFAESSNSARDGIDVDGAFGFFEMAIPGRDGQNSSRYTFDGRNYERWQASLSLKTTISGRRDSLRVGEPIRIIAINRATGYIGDIRTAIEPRGPGEFGIALGDMELLPPNIKVEIERKYEVEYGVTRGQDRVRRVGSEGSALTGDQYVSVRTEWLGQSGEPLPASLPGFTGRLATLSPGGTLDDSVHHFDITPGRHTELVKLGGSADSLQAAYLYLHVVGTPNDTRKSFEPAANGPLVHRPARYVPLRVAVHDRVASAALAGEPRSANTFGGSIEQVYRWPFRPEMMFTVLDLDVSGIAVTRDGSTIDLTDSGAPIIGAQDERLQVFNELSGPDYDPLSLFGPQGYLITDFANDQRGAFGASEWSVDGLDRRGSPDDLTTLRLFSNNDAANTLWEWSSVYLDAAVDLNRDGDITFSKSFYTDPALPKSCDELETNDSAEPTDLTTSSRPYRFWLNDNWDVVLHNGKEEEKEINCDRLEPDRARRVGFQQKCEIVGVWSSESGGSTNTDESNIRHIENTRDLEDVFPIELRMNADTLGKIESGDYQLAVQGRNVGVNLFFANVDGHLEKPAHEYVFDAEFANEILRQTRTIDGRQYLAEMNGPSVMVAKEAITATARLSGDTASVRIIAEGVDSREDVCAEDASECHLSFKIAYRGEEIGDSKVYLDLRTVERFYDTYDVGDAATPGREVGSTDSYLPVSPSRPASPSSPTKNLYDCVVAPAKMKDHYVAHVHGWRMTSGEKNVFASTAFKRLVWTGYVGSMGSFEWPTGWFYKPGHVYAILDQLILARKGIYNYNESEFIARRSGAMLLDWINSLKSDFGYRRIHVAAHSMGNLVASEALALDSTGVIDSYAPNEAAEAAGAFDSSLPDMTVSLLGEASAQTVWSALNPLSFERTEELLTLDFAALIRPTLEMPPDLYRWSNFAGADGVFHGPTDSETMALQAGSDAVPYYGRDFGENVTIANYYGLLDAAMNAWEFNQLDKPDVIDGFAYENSGICRGPVLPNTGGSVGRKWRDNTDCEYVEDASKEPVESRFYEGGSRIDWNGAGGDEEKFKILSRIIPARTRPLGKLYENMGAMPPIGNIDYLIDMNLGSGNQDHSMVYHGAVSDAHRNNRSSYWTSMYRIFGIRTNGLRR